MTARISHAGMDETINHMERMSVLDRITNSARSCGRDCAQSDRCDCQPIPAEAVSEFCGDESRKMRLGPLTSIERFGFRQRRTITLIVVAAFFCWIGSTL